MSRPHGTENGADISNDSDSPVVYDLAPACTLSDVDENKRYLATVNGVVEYGVFVDLSETVSGLVHVSNLVGSYEVGDELVVELGEIRENGDVSLIEVQLSEYERQQVGPGTQVDATTIADHAGETVHMTGRIVQVKQTGGPTIFQLRTIGGLVPCAAFDEAGVRAYPDVVIDDVVQVVGSVESYNGHHQLEVENIDVLVDQDETDVLDELAADTATLAAPADIDPLIEWTALEKLWEDLEEVARRLRETVLSGRPIRIRHHADGDGLCASLPIQYALERFIAETWADPEAPQHLLQRLPSKAPFYELEDVTRDLNYALENRDRHGQKLPLFLMCDNGSTEEDTPAYRNLAHYDVPILVVDHHHPDPDALEGLVEHHVNPYLHGEDYRITTGMMCVEIARMIDPDITAELEHVPAVAGLADRSDATAMEQYLDLAANAGYDEKTLLDIGEALDYATYWLRYRDGRELVNDILGINCDDRERHEAVVSLLSQRAARDVERQLEAAMGHVTHEELENGVRLYRLDVENHARRFTYPAPGKTTGKVHDQKVRETGGPVITIGFGPDFAVLRSDGVRLDIPEMVSELREEFPGAGVSGGGHLVVGSIKFVPGMRETIVDALVEKMTDAELDEDLGSSPPLLEDER